MQITLWNDVVIGFGKASDSVVTDEGPEGIEGV